MFSSSLIKSARNTRIIIKMIGAINAIPANPQEGMPERNDFFLIAFIRFDLASINVSKNGWISKNAYYQGIRKKKFIGRLDFLSIV